MTSEAEEKSEEHPLIGQTLRGTYQVLRALDQGGMGLVFEAEHARLRRRVAVKVMARHLTSDSQALARFNREAEIISQLEHPNIVQILDFDTTEQNEPYIVMELLKGESLSARLERDGRLPLTETVRIVSQVASGLFAAHRAAIVHRDLKPANIFLATSPGQGTLVKLLDFGISKRIGVGRSLTGEFDVLGTPDYMAPEQALGRTASVDHRGDQYALAVIAFEMLSGHTPFSGANVMEVLQQVATAEPPPVEHLAPHVSAPVSAVIHRALAKSPDARFATILEFSSALSRALESSVPPVADQLAVARTVPASKSSETARQETPRGVFQPVNEVLSSGTQRRVRFGNASTLSGSATLKDIPAALAQARQALGLGDVNLAVSYAESALRVADGFDSPEAQLLVEQEEGLIEGIFSTRLGSLRHRLNVRGAPSEVGARVSPEQAFLLSRLDGGITVEEALDISPMPRRDTLRALVGMLCDGFIDVVMPRTSSSSGQPH